jgi:hypothetical protein
VREKGAKLFVVILSTGIQVHPDPKTRSSYEKRLGVRDLFYPDRRIMGYCRGGGIPVLSLASRLQEYATSNRIFLHGFGRKLGWGHWNENGHRLAGNIIADWICE